MLYFVSILHCFFANIRRQSRKSTKQGDDSRKVGFFSRLFGSKNNPRRMRQPSSRIIKSNKAAIKVEPKVFFSNERTFLAWLHTSVLLAGASIAITSFSDNDLLSQLYGIILLPVAITFLVYAMHQCKFVFRLFFMVCLCLGGSLNILIGILFSFSSVSLLILIICITLENTV